MYHRRGNGRETERSKNGSTLNGIVYDDNDRLIQLCDSLAMATDVCLMQVRMMDVALRYGVNDFTVDKWRATFQLVAGFIIC